MEGTWKYVLLYKYLSTNSTAQKNGSVQYIEYTKHLHKLYTQALVNKPLGNGSIQSKRMQATLMHDILLYSTQDKSHNHRYSREK